METLFYWILKLLIWGLFAYFYYLQTQKDQQKKNPQPTHQNPPKYSQTYLTNPRNRQLQAQLLTLLGGDVQTAKELLLQQRKLYPGRHDNWYLAKVIDDLQRGINETTDNENYSKLLLMLQGDRYQAERLLRQQQNANPGKHYTWYLEKVIYDLERDRRS